MADESPQTLLHEAIGKERVKEVQRLLKDPEVKVNMQNYRSGQPPPLIAAVLKGSVKVLEAILEHPDVDLEYPDYDGKTALLHVCENYRSELDEAKQVKMFKLLTDLGADVNTMNKDGETPLRFAIKKQSEEMVKQLLAQPLLDPNIADSYGRTPLYHAGRERGMATIFELLLADERVDPNVQDDNGDCALIAAVKEGDAATIDVLLKCARVNVNVRDKGNYGVLHHAIYSNNIGIVQTLLENQDLDLNVIDSDGMKDFWYAAQQGKTAVVRDMMRKKEPEELDGQMAYLAAENRSERGVMNLLKKYNQMSPKVAEELLLPALKAKHSSVVSLVMKYVEDPNKHLEDGNTYLTLAIKNLGEGTERDDPGRLCVYHVLYNKKTDGTICDKDGASPYSLAFNQENQQVQQYFNTPYFRKKEVERLAALGQEKKKDAASELAAALRKFLETY